MSMKMLAGAAAVVALIATPAMAAQQKAADPQHKSAETGSVKMKKAQARMKAEPKMKKQSRLDSRGSAEQRGTGFAPLDFAGNVVGGAVNTAGAIAGGAANTAGAIATAPFRPFYGDSYAYYRDTNTGRGAIADANGPKCLPGNMTTINGQRMRCQ